MAFRLAGKTVATLSLLVAVSALGLTYFLWRQNQELRRELALGGPSAESRQRPVVRRVREGDVLPEFKALDVDGREVTVARRGSEKTLLFYYDPKCDRCAAGLPAWIKAHEKLKALGAKAEIVGLSVSDSYRTVQYARQAALPFRSVPFPSIELQRRYGATEVPLTVVIDSAGLVLGVWDKPLESGEVADVVEFVCPECVERAIVARSTNKKEENHK